MPPHRKPAYVAGCLLVLSSLFLALPACGKQPTATLDPEATPPGGEQPTPIPPPDPGQGFSKLAGQIMDHPEWYKGQHVTLVGYFRGQDLLDEVILDAPTDRLRDWVIKDDTGAIYVSYEGQLPFPPNSHDVWRIVRTSGQVQVHKNGMPYIVPAKVTWEGLKQNYDVLPADAVLAIHRFDGKDNLDHHIYLYNTRNLVVYDIKEDWRAAAQLKRREADSLLRDFAKTGFFNLPGTVGSDCKGCIRYYVAALDEKRGTPYFVTLYEGQVPEKLQAFIDQVIEKTGQARPV